MATAAGDETADLNNPVRYGNAGMRRNAGMVIRGATAIIKDRRFLAQV